MSPKVYKFAPASKAPWAADVTRYTLPVVLLGNLIKHGSLRTEQVAAQLAYPVSVATKHLHALALSGEVQYHGSLEQPGTKHLLWEFKGEPSPEVKRYLREVHHLSL